MNAEENQQNISFDQVPRELLQKILLILEKSGNVRTISSLSRVSRDIRETVADEIGLDLFQNLDIRMEIHNIQTYNKINTKIYYKNFSIKLFFNNNSIQIKSIINSNFVNNSFSCLYGKYFVEVTPINCRIFNLENGQDFKFSDIFPDFKIYHFFRIDQKSFSNFGFILSFEKKIYVDLKISEEFFNYQIANYYDRVCKKNIFISDNFIYFITLNFKIYHCIKFENFDRIFDSLKRHQNGVEEELRVIKVKSNENLKNIINLYDFLKC